MFFKSIVENYFACPVCGGSMTVTEDRKSAKCLGENPKKKCHSFDFSSDGYLSFGVTGGDSKDAVRARSRFLGKGYYELAARSVADAVKANCPDCRLLVDAGCGEGYYTAMLSSLSESTVGFDLSKFACSAGAKQARRNGMKGLLYATASVFKLPLKSGSADVVTNVFAPCAEEEYTRVLRDGGYLFVVGAGKDHLMGLKRAIYDDVYENGQRADLPCVMEHIDKIVSTYSITVNGSDDIAALFSMTPYYWRTSESDKEKLAALDSLTTEIEFEINIFRK